MVLLLHLRLRPPPPPPPLPPTPPPPPPPHPNPTPPHLTSPHLTSGARQLFTDEHDRQIERFSSESIEQILERCSTTAAADGSAPEEGSSAFAKATFAAENGTQVELEDPNFWSRLLGEEAAASVNERAGLAPAEFVDVDRTGSRSSRGVNRARETTQRLGAAGGSGNMRAADCVRDLPSVGVGSPRVEWTRPQLSALLSSLFAIGYGRVPELMLFSKPTTPLGSRSHADVEAVHATRPEPI